MEETRYFRSIARFWPSQKSVPPEAQQFSEWDRLLSKLSLNESQALEAISLQDEVGIQLRKFVSRSSKRSFVPEPVIRAVRSVRATARVSEQIG